MKWPFEYKCVSGQGFKELVDETLHVIHNLSIHIGSVLETIDKGNQLDLIEHTGFVNKCLSYLLKLTRCTSTTYNKYCPCLQNELFWTVDNKHIATIKIYVELKNKFALDIVRLFSESFESEYKNELHCIV